MRYVAIGELPHKRHVQVRDNGRLLVEEVMGYEGFSGNESILYHLESPCRLDEVGSFTPIVRDEWVPDAHVHRLADINPVPAGGDPVAGRRLLMFNDDIEVSICKPTEPLGGFYRNGEGDEVHYIHRGRGVLRTVFGRVPFRERDYVVIPRGTTVTWELDGERRAGVGVLPHPRRDRDAQPLPQPLRAAATVVFLTVGEQHQHPVMIVLLECREGSGDRPGNGCAALRNRIHVQRLYTLLKRGVVNRQRTFQKSVARERNQTQAVGRGLLHQFQRGELGAFQPVWRDVRRQHAFGSVNRHHDVPAALLDLLQIKSILRTRQCEDQKYDGQNQKNEA